MFKGALSDIKDKKWYFHLLEQLYVALEELGLPFPEEFPFVFAQFGFDTLSRRYGDNYLVLLIMIILDSSSNTLTEKYFS